VSSSLDIDPDRVAAILREAAETEILPRFRALESHEISEKNPGDLVTVADRAAEAVLTQRLAGLIPGALIVGEEAHEDRPEALGEINDAPWAWIIDPLDGTHNFAHGTPRFAVIVALVRRGETAMGWIYDPNGGHLAVAQAGAGTMIDGERMRLAAAGPVADMTGSLGHKFADRLRARAGSPGAAPIPKAFLRYRCVGLEYMDLGQGILDFARYAGKLMPWDHAAGVLMHREAGGHAAMTGDGRAYAPGRRAPGDALLLAPDAAAWMALNTLMS
jgi:fructose-1,6-bisphosphatase/inositol monophosphatase family enzyme